jgi:HAD superfamily hydrolase (TIGR01509 family)
VDLYLFDFDKTLYAYDFRKRLPALARLGGVSQYHLASTWWAAGCERRAEAGAWPTADEYLAQFARVTGAELTLEQWADARKLAMTRIDGSVAALRRAATLGTVSLLSNTPSAFAAALPMLAPDVAEILGDNRLVSAELGVRKPDPQIFRLALERFGATPETTFFADDSAANVEGAASVGIHAHLFTEPGRLDAAITDFAGRAR